MMAKHKRVLRDGQTPRGPRRWARAYGNLLENPTSPAASLLLDRLATANKFRGYEEFKLPFEHRRIRDYKAPSQTSKRAYVTCNMFCAAMVAQLDISSTNFSHVLALFNGHYLRKYNYKGVQVTSSWQEEVVPLDKSTLSRTVRCQHCGSSVAP